MNNHRLMAELCKMSYFKRGDGGFDLSRMGVYLYNVNPQLSINRTYDKHGTQALLILGKWFNIVVFRGSEEKSDWKTNFNFPMTDDSFDRIHTGFLIATLRISAEIIHDVGDLSRPLYITGHSLGGACATVLAHLFDKKRIHFKEVVTFGQPRVFGAPTARQFQARNRYKVFRYQNNNDLVPTLPPWFLGYQHIGQLRYIATDKRVLGRVPLTDRLLGAVGAFGKRGVDAIEDHNIEEYIRAL